MFHVTFEMTNEKQYMTDVYIEMTNNTCDTQHRKLETIDLKRGIINEMGNDTSCLGRCHGDIPVIGIPLYIYKWHAWPGSNSQNAVVL